VSGGSSDPLRTPEGAELPPGRAPLIRVKDVPSVDHVALPHERSQVSGPQRSELFPLGHMKDNVHVLARLERGRDVGQRREGILGLCIASGS
jgi:hypothetical protein